MKRFSEQFHKKASTIKLSASERAVLREQLMTYMEYHPVTVTNTPKTVAPTVLQDRFYTISLPRRYWQSFAGLSVIALLVVVPTLAERAVPGDVLYPIKVQVNEEIRSSLTSDGYEKIAWETERLERRISEARLLAKEGRLTAEVEAEVIAAVQTHKTTTEAEIASLRVNDTEAAALATLTLTSVLDVQSAALRANDTGSTTAGMSTVLLASVLDEAGASLKNDETTVSYERLMAQLEQETTRGRELLASIRSFATDTEKRDIERRLADVERKIGKASDIASTDTVLATESLRATWRDMQVLITFMTDIDVRNALALEQFVPVVLTPEEEQALAREAYDTAFRYYQVAVVEVPKLPEDGLKEKFVLIMPEVELLLETATTTMVSDSRGARVAAEAALVYTTDMIETVVRVNGPIADLPFTATPVATSSATSTPVIDDATETATSTPTDTAEAVTSEGEEESTDE